MVVPAGVPIEKSIAMGVIKTRCPLGAITAYIPCQKSWRTGLFVAYCPYLNSPKSVLAVEVLET